VLPIIRPCALIGHRDWAVADAYGYGPSLWVAPVLEHGAREVEVDLPEGDWIATWDGSEVHGGRVVHAPAPLDRIPVWVRRGAIIVTYPAEAVARGLGDGPKPLEATLWGEPAPGRSASKLADGTIVRWNRGEWSATTEREITFRTR
jgi:alpha-glucosidase (family GH31 glycosyl hydrolase)